MNPERESGLVIGMAIGAVLMLVGILVAMSWDWEGISDQVQSAWSGSLPMNYGGNGSNPGRIEASRNWPRLLRRRSVKRPSGCVGRSAGSEPG